MQAPAFVQRAPWPGDGGGDWGRFRSPDGSAGAATTSERSQDQEFSPADGEGWETGARSPRGADAYSPRPTPSSFGAHGRATFHTSGGRFSSGGVHAHRGRYHAGFVRGAPGPCPPFRRESAASQLGPGVRTPSRDSLPHGDGHGRYPQLHYHGNIDSENYPNNHARRQFEEDNIEKVEWESWYLESPYYRSLSMKPGMNGSFPQNDRHFKTLRHLPDIYYSKIKKTFKSNKRMPQKNHQRGEWGVLSQGIWDKYVSHRQKNDTYTRKILLWKQLNEFLEVLFPRYALYMTGSTLNGFGTEQSDLDMCLLVWEAHITRRVEAIAHLEQLLQGLRRCALVRRAELIHAKVPILKFRDARYNIDVDVNCNNDVAVRNTHLLFCYSAVDWRVKPLVVVIKLWAARHNINDAKCMTLSSYSLVLMVIHYLQCGTSPPVLPCLGRLLPDMFSPQRNVLEIDVHRRADVPRSTNAQCLGELLLGFFNYFAHFDYGRYAISVRLGAKLPIEECRRAPSPKNDERQWNLLCVEEPYELTNTAYAVFDEHAFDRVLNVIRTSYLNLQHSKELNSIFQPIGGAVCNMQNDSP